MHASRHPVRQPSSLAGRLRRIAATLALVVVMGTAFAGYLSPDMQLQWENLMALCGF